MHIPSIFPVTCHTDYVGKNTIFVAIKGNTYNGIDYIPLALEKGATTIVVEESNRLPQALITSITKYGATLIYVSHARKALADFSAQAALYPAHTLNIIGVTGTKGKTTIVYLLEHIMRSAGIKVARITGVQNSINGIELPAQLTTPQPDYLHQFFSVCLRNGVTHVVMEVAAQALSLNRLDTITFDGIIFTNIAREHFEFYHDLDDYFAAKCMIFNHIKPTTTALVNGDDSQCAQLIAKGNYIKRYGFSNQADIQATDLHNLNAVTIMYNDNYIYCPNLIGHYNASNILAAYSMSQAYGLDHTTIQHALNTFPTIPGRMERYQLTNGATCIIDYAHNPSSYEALLTTLRPLTDHLIVVFGASGSRDKGKRPLMGAIAATYADLVILTSDNPGIVDPITIINDISAGIASEFMHKIHKEPDRERAIHYGYQQSQSGSLLVLLGKGRDEYQIIGTTKHCFSERMLIKKIAELIS